MITLDDCRNLCDADPALVARVAREEALPEVLALARAQQLCQVANQEFAGARHARYAHHARYARHTPAGADRLAA